MASQPGNIADSSTMDTESANGTAVYPKQAHGVSKTYLTIYSGGGLVSGIDPIVPATPVTGIPINPLVPPVPQPLVRPKVVAIVNTDARGVYFEGTLVPVIGDGVSGAGAAPDPRILTMPGKYGSIFIGTRT